MTKKANKAVRVEVVAVRKVYNPSVIFTNSMGTMSYEDYIDNLDADRAMEEARREGTTPVDEFRTELGL